MSDLKAVIVQCGNEEYAIAVDTVVSIERLEQINPIPHLPEYMLGLMRIRGELVPILDFEQILYGKTAQGYEDARVVVVQTGSLYIGLLVLNAKEILDIPESALTSSGLIAYSRTPYFTTVANLENRMITVVDPEILSQTLAGMDKIGEYVEAQLAQEK
ncbi:MULTISPECIES: chemotaxis protein CheW [Sporosarcina]|uniref:Purine-binding chemotaxis protein CheW n=1 Tax=Sporosarcina psychrophila TaxID=1476 RepID=A0ABV2K743_SPOPS|nr:MULTISPECIES: chemotaxis protein CheW [Sporosarcina]AMQ06377.1 chemotaxis protein CheW [Sporosarcina psychrophila]QNK86099.1 chemotaxis protein CheW [Sporosarcina sp. resist]